MNIQLVGIQHIDGVWPSIKHQIKAAITKCDNLSLSGLYGICRSGQGFLFVSDDLKTSAIVSFETRNGTESARILALGSDANTDWKSDIEVIRKFANANGAEKVVFQGRKGWARVMGIKPKYYHYEV